MPGAPDFSLEKCALMPVPTDGVEDASIQSRKEAGVERKEANTLLPSAGRMSVKPGEEMARSPSNPQTLNITRIPAPQQRQTAK